MNFLSVVEVGGGPLIAHSVQALRQAGVREFVFVVGWRKAAYAAWCAAEGPGAICVENADYASTGSLRSLILGGAAAPGREILLVESDLLFERRAPEHLLAASSSDSVLISDFTASHDEVWAYARNGDAARLSHLTKTKSPERGEPVGELVGLARLSAALVGRLTAAARTLPAAAHYEDGLNAVSDAHRIALLRVPGLAWCEIDDADHLDRARSVIWPRVAAANSARRQAGP